MKSALIIRTLSEGYDCLGVLNHIYIYVPVIAGAFETNISSDYWCVHVAAPHESCFIAIKIWLEAFWVLRAMWLLGSPRKHTCLPHITTQLDLDAVIQKVKWGNGCSALSTNFCFNNKNNRLSISLGKCNIVHLLLFHDSSPWYIDVTIAKKRNCCPEIFFSWVVFSYFWHGGLDQTVLRAVYSLEAGGSPPLAYI